MLVCVTYYSNLGSDIYTHMYIVKLQMDMGAGCIVPFIILMTSCTQYKGGRHNEISSSEVEL